VNRFLQQIVSIALLRAGPQDLPASSTLMGAAIVATAVINAVVMQQYATDAEPLLHIMLLLGFSLAYLALVLQLTGHMPRFIQSATALFGTDAFISMAAVPVLVLVGPPTDVTTGGAFAYLALLIWNVAVVNHILREAMSVSTAISLATSLGYILGASAFVQLVTGG